MTLAIPDFISLIGFPVLALTYYYLLLNEFRKNASPQHAKTVQIMLWSLLAWTAFISIWSLSGMMRDFQFVPFNLLPVFLIPMVAILFLTFTRPMSEILLAVPPDRLIVLQNFRIFVELVIWLLYLARRLPVQVTFEGRNFDIITGLSALLMAFLVRKEMIGHIGLVLWNIAGLCLLINVAGTAVLSMPTPLRHFMNEPDSSLVTRFPYAFLPGLLVPLAYTLHFLSLRQLALKKKRD
jgi:hypothetical protein